MKRILAAVCFVLGCGGILQGQTPTITGLAGEGVNAFCPGGVGFVNGTNLGTSTSIVVTVGTKQAHVINAHSTSLQIQFPVDAPLGATTIKAGASTPFNLTLGQFCPGIPIDNGVTGAVHMSNGAKVTAGYPASPNEQIGLSASGLGPTNPVFATGTAPDDGDLSAVTVTKPAITVASLNATVSTAYLQPNNPGFYLVVFTVPAAVTTGTRQVALTIGGLTSTANLPVSTAPVVTSVSNAATYIDQGPRFGIAPGGIFVLKGANLGPADISVDPKPFQNTTLSGTSVAVAINGATIQALMYYTSAGQVAALLPSNSPTGTGTVTVTYDGQTGPTATFRISQNNPGIFTVTSDGNGAGIVTYPDYSLVSTTKAANCGGVYTTCGAANPGDVLVIWATGLGPIDGNDAAGAGLGVNQPSVPLTIWVGDVQTTAAYQGRSGCCIGEDQIVFTVPPNSPLGCAVPLSLQIANGSSIIGVSNTVLLPIASAGSRTCQPVSPPFSTATVVQSTTDAPITYGEIDLERHDNLQDGGSGLQDLLHASLLRFSLPSTVRPFIFSYIDSPPLGTCHTYNQVDGEADPPLDNLVGLDAGQVTLQGPNGSKSASGNGDFSLTLSPTGNFLSAGQYTVSATGAAGVSAFNASIAIPVMPTLTSPPPDKAAPFSVTRANGLNVTWSGGTSTGQIEISGYSNTDNTYSAGASFRCLVSAAKGSFTIPPNVLLAMPPTSFGGLLFQPTVTSVDLPGSGLVLGYIEAHHQYFAGLSFN